MSRAVRFDRYGPVEELRVDEVDRPAPGPGQVLVEVVAAGTNPGEIAIREGAMHARYPATFPSGQGSDFAGRVVALGEGVTVPEVGAEVIGFTDNRASQADFVVADSGNVAPKPSEVGWDEAGGLKVAGTTAYAVVRAVAPRSGETVVVSGASGGVGSLAVQLARRAGARVLGIASAGSAEFVRGLGAEPVAYGDGLADRLRAAASGGIDAFVDTFGDGYLDLARERGVDPARAATIIDFPGAEKTGAQAVMGAEASSGAVLGELAAMIAKGELTVPIAATYPLADVQDAYRELEQRHTHGKVVLRLR